MSQKNVEFDEMIDQFKEWLFERNPLRFFHVKMTELMIYFIVRKKEEPFLKTKRSCFLKIFRFCLNVYIIFILRNEISLF